MVSCCNVVGFGVFLGECMAYFCNIMAFLCIVVLCFLVGYRFAWCFVGFDWILCCNVVGFGVFLGECMAYFCNMMAFLCIVVLCFWVG